MCDVPSLSDTLTMEDALAVNLPFFSSQYSSTRSLISQLFVSEAVKWVRHDWLNGVQGPLSSYWQEHQRYAAARPYPAVGAEDVVGKVERVMRLNVDNLAASRRRPCGDTFSRQRSRKCSIDLLSLVRGELPRHADPEAGCFE